MRRCCERYGPRAVLGLTGVPEGLPLSDADRATVQAELEGIFPIDQRIYGIVFDTFTSTLTSTPATPARHHRPDTAVPWPRRPGPAHTTARSGLTEQIPGAILGPRRYGLENQGSVMSPRILFGALAVRARGRFVLEPDERDELTLRRDAGGAPEEPLRARLELLVHCSHCARSAVGSFVLTTSRSCSWPDEMVHQ